MTVRLCAACLIAALVLWCATETRAQEVSSPLKEADFVITINKRKVDLLNESLPAIAKKVRKKSKTIQTADGKTELTVSTTQALLRTMHDRDHVLTYAFLTKRAQTARGLKIGQSIDKLYQLYGKPFSESGTDAVSSGTIFCSYLMEPAFDSVKRNGVQMDYYHEMSVQINFQTQKITGISFYAYPKSTDS